MKVTTDSCLFGAWCAAEIKKQQRQPDKLLDIGAGTGLLSLMIAQQNRIKITALEIDSDAATQAQANITASPWPQIQLLEQDVRTYSTPQQFDVIVSNPPFYQTSLKSPDAKRALAHHSTALTISELLLVVQQHLQTNGLFFLLIPYQRRTETEKNLKAASLFIYQKTEVRPTFRHQPFRVMIMAGKENTGMQYNSEIVIRNEDNSYTEGFAALLKDYYLYL